MTCWPSLRWRANRNVPLASIYLNLIDFLILFVRKLQNEQRGAVGQEWAARGGVSQWAGRGPAYITTFSCPGEHCNQLARESKNHRTVWSENFLWQPAFQNKLHHMFRSVQNVFADCNSTGTFQIIFNVCNAIHVLCECGSTRVCTGMMKLAASRLRERREKG